MTARLLLAAVVRRLSAGDVRRLPGRHPAHVRRVLVVGLLLLVRLLRRRVLLVMLTTVTTVTTTR